MTRRLCPLGGSTGCPSKREKVWKAKMAMGTTCCTGTGCANIGLSVCTFVTDTGAPACACKRMALCEQQRPASTVSVAGLGLDLQQERLAFTALGACPAQHLPKSELNVISCPRKLHTRSYTVNPREEAKTVNARNMWNTFFIQKTVDWTFKTTVSSWILQHFRGAAFVKGKTDTA